MQRAFGARFRTFLSSALRRKWQAFIAGTVVTAVLQSSTATALMMTGFVGAGWVSLASSLAVMLGAYVGTTLIVQALAFPVTALVPVLALAGIILLRRVDGIGSRLSAAFLGLALIVLSLHQLMQAVVPETQGPLMRIVWTQLSEQPVMALIVGALLAWAAHSSVAIVLLVMSVGAQQMIPLSAAITLVLGANLGTALNPLFEGAARTDPEARRLPLGNLILRVLGVLLAVVLLAPITVAVGRLPFDTSHRIAMFHTGFNVAVALLCLPWLTPYGRWLERWLPGRALSSDAAAPLYLSRNVQETPVFALARAARETLRLTDSLERMLIGLRQAFDHGEPETIQQTRELDNVLDRLNDAIKTHVMGLDPATMSEADLRRASHILSFATHLEQAGDLIDLRLLTLASKRVKRGLAFSREGRLELLQLIDRLQLNIRSAANVFMSADPRAARVLAHEKTAFRERIEQTTQSHFLRLRSGRISSIETSGLHLDTLYVLKQVNSHLVAGAAYPLLEDIGALLPSRLMPDNDIPRRGEAGVT